MLRPNFNSDIKEGVTEVARRENLTCKRWREYFTCNFLVMNVVPESEVHSILGELDK